MASARCGHAKVSSITRPGSSAQVSSTCRPQKTRSFDSDLVAVLLTEQDLFDLLLMTECVAIIVRFESNLDGIDQVFVLWVTQHCLCHVANPSDRLWEDDPVELEVEMGGSDGSGICSCGFCTRLHDTLVRHGALLVDAVHEGTWCDYLRLRALLSALSLVIHLGNVVEKEHVEGVTALASRKPHHLDNVPPIKLKVVH